jgi:hypothetical protein
VESRSDHGLLRLLCGESEDGAAIQAAIMEFANAGGALH